MLSAIYRLAAPTAIIVCPSDYQTPLAYMMLMNRSASRTAARVFTLKPQNFVVTAGAAVP